MSEFNFLPKAIEMVKQAVAEDNAEHYDKAKFLYTQSLEYFMMGLKYEKNERTKISIRARMEEYMKRAEEISGILEQQKEAKSAEAAAAAGGGAKKKVVSGGGAGKAGGDDKKDGDEEDDGLDPETKKLHASLSHAILVERPNVKWSDVAGLDTAKQLTKETVLMPMMFPQLFTGNRKPWRGLLFYGPPGTGKSHLARAVATEVKNATFFSVSSSDLVSKYQGESERLVRGLWELARKKKPSIIFIDEIDALCSARKDGDNDATTRIKTELLIQFDGVSNSADGVLVLGATNTPWALDQAVRRRFEKRIYIPLPDERARATMLRINLGKTPNNLQDEHFQLIAQRTEGYSGHDMSIVVKEALMEPIRCLQEATHFHKVAGPDAATDPESYFVEACAPSDPTGTEMTLYDVPPAKLRPADVSFNDFLKALRTTRPSVNPGELERYEQWTKDFGQDG